MPRRMGVVLGLAALILVCQAVIGAAVYIFLPTWESRGQFGDMFGAANPGGSSSPTRAATSVALRQFMSVSYS